MSENDLLQDKEFLLIQKLNSRDSEKRHSIAYDKTLNIMDESDEIDGKRGNIKDQEELKRIISHHNDDDNKLLQNDEFVKKYLKNLHTAEKRRYRNESVISFFSDVDFDNRPTIFDGAINEPYLASFSGPVLEKQIRAFEKSKQEFKEENEENLDKIEESSDYSKSDATSQAATPVASTSEYTDKLVPTSSELRKPSLAYQNKFISNFSGLYVMFWMILSLFMIRGMIDYYTEHDGDLTHIEIFNMFGSKLSSVAMFDFCMYLASYFVVLVQWLCKKNIIEWKNTGKIIISIYELTYMLFCYYAILNWFGFNWISRIFLFLHSVVFLMKMHSYSFFNGYLWNITRELAFSKRGLAKYKETANKAIVETLERSRDFCEFELYTQSVSGTKEVQFPDNITISNYFMFTMFPTVVYQFEYPRTKNIRWNYVIEKLFAVFGTIFVLIVVAQLFILPPITRALQFRNVPWPNGTVRTIEWFYLVAEVNPGLTVIYMLMFYLIWDAILNCFAELTRFADRYFYGDWWNCVSWSEFSRIWNVPVHKFLLRHVYHSSMNSWKLSKVQATFFTFILSAIFHEASMYVIFKRFRCYLFLFQLAQLPMAFVSSMKFLREKTVFNNVLFWAGVCSGPAVITALYVMF